MEKKSTSIIILFAALFLFIVLDKLGFTLISQIVGGLFTIAALILNLSNIKAMNKKLLATTMTLMIVPGLVMLYGALFTENTYLTYGGFICFMISIPISLVIVYFYRKTVQNKLN